MDFPDDAELVAVLTHFGVSPDALLGHGGEAWVYALAGGRILRVLHAGGSAADVRARQELVDELVLAAPPFALSRVIDTGAHRGRVFTVERRLPGRSVLDELATSEGSGRTHLIDAYLDAVAALGDLHLAPRSHFGDLIADDAVHTVTWREYLAQRAARNLSRSTPEFHTIDAQVLAAELPDAATGAFVHLDAFAGNVLTDGLHITAVLDFGPTCAVGDRRLDPVSAAVYLASREITPTATPRDVDVAMSWLRAAGLDDWFVPVRRWLAAYWSFAVDDAKLHDWCRAVLL